MSTDLQNSFNREHWKPFRKWAPVSPPTYIFLKLTQTTESWEPKSHPSLGVKDCDWWQHPCLSWLPIKQDPIERDTFSSQSWICNKMMHSPQGINLPFMPRSHNVLLESVSYRKSCNTVRCSILPSPAPSNPSSPKRLSYLHKEDKGKAFLDLKSLVPRCKKHKEDAKKNKQK